MTTAESGTIGSKIIDGRAMAAEMFEETRARIVAVSQRTGTPPGIRVVRVGEDPASAVYARRIVKSAERVGALGSQVELGAESGAATIRDKLRSLSDDPAVAGIILQLPLPAGVSLASVVDGLDPEKDLDGIHPLNAGLVARDEGGFSPSCPEAAMEMLRRSGTGLRGRQAVVVGRSNVVGKPAELLLLREDATVTVCHRKTRDLGSEVRRGDVVVVAAGVPGLITGEMVKPGATIIDCGINVLPDGSLSGDADPISVPRVAGALTPVPGGVGPVTNAVLMAHLADAAERGSGNVSSLSS